MNPSYFRIRLPMPNAMVRFASWFGLPELEPPKVVPLLDAVDAACDENGQWRGSALYVYENSGWTVFEDLSGHCGSIPADSWLSFAESDDFVFAGYNDAISYGELIVIENGTVVREFLYDADNAEVNVNRGELTGSPIEPMESWIEAASFVDDDDLAYSENGLLWLHGKPA
ncbi:MAG TPA: hypothetical protein VKN18_23720 [Blastocatellia bacterium]|nr:hypothetical protein [Blastocatellia bacterium]